jgi:hypothetical protein
MRGSIPPLPNMPSWRGAQLKKHRDNFTFAFILSYFAYVFGLDVYLLQKAQLKS